MTLFLRAALPLALIALAPTAAALAADYDPPVYVEQAEEYVPVEIGSGWYLRGDVGYAMSARSTGIFTYRTFDPLAIPPYSTSNFVTGGIDTDLTAGIGIGYQFNQYLRGDVTLDGFRGQFTGSTAAPAPCLPDAIYVGTTCRSEDTADFSVVSLMANGYVDLGTYAGFTPYAGAGLGTSYVSWSGLDNQSFCVNGVNPCPVPGGATTATPHPGEKSWRFTYAFMGGVAYDITKNFKVDLGYKYTKIAEGPMFGWGAVVAASGASGVQGRDPGMAQHEVRVGLRYALW
ncbi:MAG: porin family protein [Mesorhizobium sp.]|nr:porin family protein [Mesorhizobium sp.]